MSQELVVLRNRICMLQDELETLRKALAEKLELELSIFVNPQDRLVTYTIEYKMRESEKYQCRNAVEIVQAIIDGVAAAIRRDFSDDIEQKKMRASAIEV